MNYEWVGIEVLHHQSRVTSKLRYIKKSRAAKPLAQIQIAYKYNFELIPSHCN